jgi:signal transduction histidine kinase
MSQPERADAIDTRLIFRVYAAIIGGAGILVYLWPARMLPDPWSQWLIEQPDLPGIRGGHYALVRICATALTAAGLIAGILASIDDPRSRRRALVQFAVMHLFTGAMFWLQWSEVLAQTAPAKPGIAVIAVGLMLAYAALTQHTADPVRGLQSVITLFGQPEAAPVDRLRSQYEEQIARVARQEERSRLARDLHDAVKQQLFVVQTAAATAQERFDADAEGARTAISRIRDAAREATTEMEAMIDQLQSPPLANAGFLAALRQQCDALRFRTGASVTLQADALPAEWALPPGTPEALFRIAQEAFANIARHARARAVTVRIDVVGSRLTLTIRDDGQGFDMADTRRGVGTTSMRERAEGVGGTFELSSRPRSGTTVRASLSYETATPRDFLRYALWWSALLGGTLVAVFTTTTLTDDFPIGLLCIATGALLTTLRNIAAWAKLRRRIQAAA